MIDRPRLSCVDVEELAALHVLDALDAAEATEVAAHLADHPERHPAFSELAGVTPFLAETVAPVAPPQELRARVLGAVAATEPFAAVPAARAVPAAQAAQASGIPREAALPWPAPTPLERTREARRRSPLRAVLAAAAVLAIVLLGGWNVVQLQQRAETDRRLGLLASAVAAAGQPGAAVAAMRGSESAAGAAGYAVFPPDTSGYIVITGLPPVPGDRTWQAWTLVGDQAASAGLISVGSDGLAILEGIQGVPGTELVALTIEPSGGSAGPTTAPVVVGRLEDPLTGDAGTRLAGVP